MISTKHCVAIAVMMVMGLAGHAQQSGQTSATESDMRYAPLIYDNDARQAQPAAQSDGLYSLDAGDSWLKEAMNEAERTRAIRDRAMIDNPQLVAYNAGRLPEAPPEGVISADPRQGMLTVAPAQFVAQDVTPPDAPLLPIHNWLHVFNASLQFTQAYISGNWFQGGENNLALLGSINWTFEDDGGTIQAAVSIQGGKCHLLEKHLNVALSPAFGCL